MQNMLRSAAQPRHSSKVEMQRRVQWEEQGANHQDFTNPARLPPSRLHQREVEEQQEPPSKGTPAEKKKRKFADKDSVEVSGTA